MASRTAVLILRFLSLLLLAAWLVLIAADKLTISFDPLRGTSKPAATVALVVVLVDVVFTMTLAMGAAAGLGFTNDAKRYVDKVLFGGDDGGDNGSPELDRIHGDADSFFDLAYASSGLMLAAAACTARMIMISVYSLVKS
nr:unnamed protein product [Digitaria exilis]